MSYRDIQKQEMIVVMTENINTPLALLYQTMINQGIITPVEIVTDFRYPSLLKPVASVATNGVLVNGSNQGSGSAKLVSNSSGNK